MIHAASKNTASVVTNIRPTDVQPNAIDVRVNKVLAIDAKAVFEIDENHKVHRGGAELEPDADGWFELPPGNGASPSWLPTSTMSTNANAVCSQCGSCALCECATSCTNDSPTALSRAAGSYEAIMDAYVTVGAVEAGWVVPRSTLNRNGLFITSGLYDSGYR